MSFPPFLFRQAFAFAFPPNSRRLRSTLPFFRRATGVLVLCFLSFSPRQGSLCCIQMILQHQEIKRGYLFRSSTCLSLPDLSVLPRPAEMGWVWCTWSAWTAVIVFDHFFFPDYKHILKSWECPLTFSFVKKAQKNTAFGAYFFPFASEIWQALEGSLAFIRFGRAEQVHHSSSCRAGAPTLILTTCLFRTGVPSR